MDEDSLKYNVGDLVLMESKIKDWKPVLGVIYKIQYIKSEYFYYVDWFNGTTNSFPYSKRIIKAYRKYFELALEKGFR
jgi:hypothetical protein